MGGAILSRMLRLLRKGLLNRPGPPGRSPPTVGPVTSANLCASALAWGSGASHRPYTLPRGGRGLCQSLTHRVTLDVSCDTVQLIRLVILTSDQGGRILDRVLCHFAAMRQDPILVGSTHSGRNQGPRSPYRSPVPAFPQGSWILPRGTSVGVPGSHFWSRCSLLLVWSSFLDLFSGQI